MKAKQSTQLQALSRQQRQKLVRDLVEENDKLQAVAIRQLRPYIFGKAEGPLPEEAKDRFIQPALAIIQSLLADRDWERRWLDKLEEELKRSPTEEEILLRRSPIVGAIEEIIRAPEFQFKMDRWNLSNLYLAGLKWSGRDLVGSTCYHTIFLSTDLTEADLSRANLSGAYFGDANLTGAELSYANFAEAVVDGTKIDIKWKELIDASDPPVRGTPDYIGGEEDEDDE